MCKVFPDIPRQTIKSRLRALGLKLVRCHNNLQDNIRKARSQIAGSKVISLISKRDVSVLEACHQSHMQNESARCFEPGSPNSFENNIDEEKSDTFWTVGRDFNQGAKADYHSLSTPQLVNKDYQKKTNFPAYKQCAQRLLIPQQDVPRHRLYKHQSGLEAWVRMNALFRNSDQKVKQGI